MFNDIEDNHDPRARNARHFLTNILVIAILAVLAGNDDYPGVVDYLLKVPLSPAAVK